MATAIDRVKAILNTLKIRGIYPTGYLGSGGQCDVVQGIIDPRLVDAATLVEMFTARRAHEMMEDKRRSKVYNVDDYRQMARNEAQGLNPNVLRRYVDENIFERFLHKSTKQSRAGGALYTCAIKAYKSNMQDFRVEREKRASGFSHPHGAYILFVSNGDRQSAAKNKVAVLERVTPMPAAARESLTLEDYLGIGIQAARFLEVFHEHGLFHRDIKPENIIITESGNAKIVDYGNIVHDSSDKAAQLLTQTVDGKLFVTTAYAAPEQVHSAKDVNGRTDMYSLAATIYYWITGGKFANQAPHGEDEAFAKTKKEAFFKNLMFMTPLSRDMYHRPVSVLRLKDCYGDAVSDEERKIAVGQTLRNLERTLSGMMNIEVDRRYDDIKQAREDLEAVLRGKKPANVAGKVKELGIGMDHYIKETFADENPTIHPFEYTDVPEMPSESKSYARLALAALTGTAAGLGIASCIYGVDNVCNAIKYLFTGN